MLLSKFLKKETSRRLQCQDSRFRLGLPDLSGYTRTARKGLPQVFIFGGGESDPSKHKLSQAGNLGSSVEFLHLGKPSVANKRKSRSHMCHQTQM